MGIFSLGKFSSFLGNFQGVLRGIFLELSQTFRYLFYGNILRKCQRISIRNISLFSKFMYDFLKKFLKDLLDFPHLGWGNSIVFLKALKENYFHLKIYFSRDEFL